MIDKSGHLKLIDFGLSKDGWKSKYTKASFRLPGEPGSDDALKPKKKKKNLLLRGWTATWSLFSRDKGADDAPPESARSDRSDKPRIRKNWSVVGSPEYMAVEILSQEGYDHLCDFWSLGVILYEFVFGATPFGAPSALQVFNNIKNWQSRLAQPPSVDGEEYPVSPDCWDLITKLICAPENRLGKRGIDEIKHHPFFRGIDFQHIKDSNPPFIPNLADELDTSYFVGMDEEDDENDETTESIDALLDRALSKSKKQQSETTLSTIFSHKDSKKSKKLTEEQGSAAADLIERKEGSDSNKVMFTASASRFDFAGFGYKHDEITTGPSGVAPLKDFSALRQSGGTGTTPKTSPRGTLSSPSTPRATLDEREHASRENGSISAPVTPGSSSSTVSKSPREGSFFFQAEDGIRDERGDTMIRSASGGNIRSPLPTRSGSPGPPDHPHSPKNTPPDSPRHSGSSEHDMGKKKGHKRQTSTTIVVSPRLDVEPGLDTTRIDDSITNSTESSQGQSGGTLSKIKKRLSALRNKFKNSGSAGSSSDLSADEHAGGRDSSRNSPMPHNTDAEEEEHHGRSLTRKNSGGRSRSPSVDHSRHSITSSQSASPTSSAPTSGRARAGSVGFDNRHSIIESDVSKAQKRASEGRSSRARAKVPRAESEVQTSATSSAPTKSNVGRTSTSSGSTAPAVSLTPEAQRWKDRILQKAASASITSPSQEDDIAKQLKFRDRILAKAALQLQPGSPGASAPGSPSASPPSSTTVSPSPSFSGLTPSSRTSKKAKKSPRPSLEGDRTPSGSPTDTPTELSPRDSKEEKRKSAGRKKRSNSHAVTSPIPVASLISLPGTPLENSPESSPRDGTSQPSSPRFIKTSVGKTKTSDKVIHAASSPHLPESPAEATGRPRRGTIASTTSPLDHLEVKESKKEKRRSEGRPKREKRARSDIPAIVEDPVAEQHVSPPHTSPKRDDDRHDSKSSPEGSSKHRIVIR
eukprot:TRINITY_DN872_c0_g1_i2.p1 TRINITY_DN872_c0_g1~~TRINITY_DN872_c0_g1_i2.p1  ORF type:complete len:980 (-),score=143.81 TRINITY_DN872_c0_g1_i2:60-2999(-)